MADACGKSAKHGDEDAGSLPESSRTAREEIDGNTLFNFVSTPDIIGGDSGSPVVDASGDLVGVIFDGDLQSSILDIGSTRGHGAGRSGRRQSHSGIPRERLRHGSAGEHAHRLFDRGRPEMENGCTAAVLWTAAVSLLGPDGEGRAFPPFPVRGGVAG